MWYLIYVKFNLFAMDLYVVVEGYGNNQCWLKWNQNQEPGFTFDKPPGVSLSEANKLKCSADTSLTLTVVKVL